MNDEIGTVISLFESPSPSNVSFIVNQGKLHKGQYVELEYSEGTMVCLVSELFKTNHYFERAESVKEFESNGKSLSELFPVNDWEYLIARTKPLGVFKDNEIKRPSFPPSPGTKVRIAENSILKRFIGFEENGLELGKIQFHDLSVKLNLSRLIQKHIAILAISGAGKTVASTVLIEELLSRKKEQGRIGIILFDVHSEYGHLSEPDADNEFANKTKLVKASEIRIAVPQLYAANFQAFCPEMSAIQKRELDKILQKLRNEMRNGQGPFNLVSVIDELKNDENINENTKGSLLSWLTELESYNLFSNIGQPSINDLIEPGKLTVIDLGDLINAKKKQMIVSHFCNALFKARRELKVCPHLIVLEEAHQMCPETASKENAISKGIIQTIAREGRKFGSNLCLISQRPVNLSTTALSQCGTHLYLRITNPYDLDHIKKSSEAVDQASCDMLSSFKVGEALMVGNAVNSPVFFKVRQKRSKASKHEQTLEEKALSFEQAKEKNFKEVKEFI